MVSIKMEEYELLYNLTYHDVIVSEFHMGIFTGIPPFGVAFLLFMLLISLFTSLTLKY